MHAPYDRSRQSDQSTGSRNVIKSLAVRLLITIALFVLALAEPKATVWVSQAVEAEFGTGTTAASPVETAQPNAAAPMKTVRAN